MRKALILAGAMWLAGLCRAAGLPADVAWRGWSDAAFTAARREHRLVLLDLGAVWCHWCHVMEETTYRDPKVVALLERHFVAVRVDQDSRPDLSNRYEDYGWPATIIFDATGKELVKFAGYIPPARMAALLEAVVADPTPGPSAMPETASAGSAALTPELRKDLEALVATRYDQEHGGWGFSKKYLDWDSVEYCALRAGAGDADAERMARQTLEKSRRLIDPVWGGLYQYSDSGDWDHPHFEKLAQFQAEGMRLYAEAYRRWRNPADLAAARDIHRYARAFLTSPEGASYVSQDADLVAGEHSGTYYALDDAGRRRRGIPRVDTHVYSRETAWMANALAALYAATGERAFLEEALSAARWIVAARALPGGGFRHDASDAAGPYLGDTVAAGRAFLALYAATGDRAWLSRARGAADDLEKTFAVAGTPGFASAVARGLYAPPRPQRDENVLAARFLNLLFRYTGDPRYRRGAGEAMRFLAAREVAEKFPTASILLVDAELSSEPAHLTVVGPREDPRTQALLVAAVGLPGGYRRIELWDRREGPLPNSDVEFPELDAPAAFACSGTRCSLPALTPDALRQRAERLSAPATTAP
ncbi:MAG TPA: DUF255 domain-containing protein [Thermoanaerobaculia bacterium]|jgi:uncharacterized protein YyaL (SSP411 family)|nr:DUF255 domain-containing protein [Thermoanaerobaculia bacterium]